MKENKGCDRGARVDILSIWHIVNDPFPPVCVPDIAPCLRPVEDCLMQLLAKVSAEADLAIHGTRLSAEFSA